jgi:hypothetical protein
MIGGDSRQIAMTLQCSNERAADRSFSRISDGLFHGDGGFPKARTFLHQDAVDQRVQQSVETS